MYDKIHKRFLHMPSYKAEGEITYYTNKTKNPYKFVEYYDGNSNHLMHYTDDGLKMYVNSYGVNIKYDGDNVVKISDDDTGYRYIFADCFFENYYTKETSLSDGNSKYILLETEGDTKDVSIVKLWIDSDTVLPHHMEIYDRDNKVICKIEFTYFDYGYIPDKELFVF